jgi:hypothetical protein
MLTLIVAITVAARAVAPATLTVAAVRQSLIGQWQGKLEYRDYQADRWFGLPVKVAVRDGGDNVTLIRVADFDDGPTTGNVRITTVSILDGATETSAAFARAANPSLAPPPWPCCQEARTPHNGPLSRPQQAPTTTAPPFSDRPLPETAIN